jgi:hypothetical protein
MSQDQLPRHQSNKTHLLAFDLQNRPASKSVSQARHPGALAQQSVQKIRSHLLVTASDPLQDCKCGAVVCEELVHDGAAEPERSSRFLRYMQAVAIAAQSMRRDVLLEVWKREMWSVEAMHTDRRE